MVHFFTTTEGYTIYMGEDKYENEDLIKYGWPEDIWFHVDDMSSAHVYLRLRKNQRLEDVSDATIQECAQLVKANSIEGCKLKEVTVSKSKIYYAYVVTASRIMLIILPSFPSSLHQMEKPQEDFRHGSRCHRLP